MSNKEKAYTDMINQNQVLIYKIASLYTNNNEDREDLIQEIALQLWKSFDSFQSKSSLSTWLYRVGMNTAIQFLKKEKRQIKKLKLGNEFSTMSNESQNSREDSIQQMLQKIQTLGALEKGIILLYLEEKSHKEIGEIIGISTSNVGTRIQRIKQKLKK